jgi:hypothetical protein
MNDRDTEIFKDMMQRYQWQWDKNQYMRTNYDSDLEYYRGYRNAGDYPLAFNEVFNRILPIIHTLLSRFMDQLYQSGNIISVSPRKKKDIDRAKSVEGVLNYQMETLNDIDGHGGSYLTMMKWFFNTITFGKGISKVYWRKEERISPKRIAMPLPNFDRMGNFQGFDIVDHISQEMQTVYNGPYMEVLHNKCFVPHPEYKSIQQMPQVFIVYKRSIDEIKRLADKGIYKNIDELGLQGTGYSSYEGDSSEMVSKSKTMEGYENNEGQDSKRKTPEVDVIECYAKLILKDEPYEVGSGLKIKGKEEECILHIGNYKTILSLQVSPYGIRPLFDMGCYYHPELYWDLGMVELTKGIQEQINNLGNLRMSNAFMSLNPMIKVLNDADIDPEYLTWKPFGIVPVDTQQDIEPLIVPDTNSNLFMEQEMFYKNTIQDIMGMYDYNMGATPTRQERVGVVYGIQAMGEARAKLLLMSMDYLGIRPLLKYMMLLNTFHLPSGFEYRIGDGDNKQFGNVFGDDIHCDFDFAARYTAMEPALGKQFRAQQLIQMAQMWMQSPWINQYQMNKTVMELLDIKEADQLMKTPQQMQQEQMQAVQQQMMAMQQQQRGEVEKKMTEIGGKAKADSQLSEQEFRQELILKSIENEAAEDVARIQMSNARASR